MAKSCRVLGSTEENWTKSTAGGTGVVVFGALLNCVVDLHNVTSVARDLVEKHVLLRSRIVENAKGKLCLEAGESVRTDMVQDKPWPSLEGVEQAGVILFPGDHHDKHGSLALQSIVTEELNIKFLNSEGNSCPPLNVFQVHSYTNRSRHQTVIILRFHSGVLDRQSGHVVAQEFLASLNSCLEGIHPSEPNNEDDALPQAIEDLIPKGKASKGILQKGVDAVGYAYNAKKYGLLPFQPSFTAGSKPTFQSDVVSLSLGREGTIAFLAACKENGSTYASALAAAFLKRAAELTELKDKKQEEFAYTCVLDCRSMLEPKLSERLLGNYSLGIPQDEKVKSTIEFWEFARQISASIEKDMGKSKHFLEMSVLGMLFSQVMKHPSVTPSASMRTGLFSFFIDGPLDAEWKGTKGMGLVGSLGPFSSMHFVGPCFCLGEAMVEGPELLLSFIYPLPLYSREQMYQFLCSSVDLLHESSRKC